MNFVMLLDASTFCADTANIWSLVGTILTIFKIVIPLLLIIFGMVDLGKAVIGSKEDDIKKATMSLMKRAIAAVVIFFIPTIVSVVIGLVDNENKNWEICRNCVSGGQCDTSKFE